MRSEEEIKKLFDRLNNDNEVTTELDNRGFINFTEKGGHWLDCLEWVLNQKEEGSK